MAPTYRLRLAPLALAAAVLLLAGCGGSAGIPQHMRGPSPEHAVESVIALINQERTKRGLNALTVDPKLADAAQMHARYMAVNDCYAHKCPKGMTVTERIRHVGFTGFSASENIYASPRTPEAVVDGWMKSKGHRENILDTGSKVIGVGHYYLAPDGGRLQYYHYWVANFSTGVPIMGSIPASR